MHLCTSMGIIHNGLQWSCRERDRVSWVSTGEGPPGGPPGLAWRLPCETWEREARNWLAGMGGKWLLLVLLLLKPPRLDMLATDAPPGVAGGVAAHATQRLTHHPIPKDICCPVPCVVPFCALS